MKRQGIFLRTVKSRNRGRASERAVCGVFSDFSLAEPASRPAYAPATTSPARCRAGRAKQHNHARNVKPFPSSEESGAGSARCLVRPKRPALQGEVPRGEAIHISAPWSLGCARRHVWSGRSALPGTVPRGEAIHISAPLSLGCARSLVRPIFLCCSLYHAPGLFPCFFILPLAGPASHPAYAPTTKSPARYSAGRAKQHNHARNVTPSPLGGVRGEPSPGRRG